MMKRPHGNRRCLLWCVALCAIAVSVVACKKSSPVVTGAVTGAGPGTVTGTVPGAVTGTGTVAVPGAVTVTATALPAAATRTLTTGSWTLTWDSIRATAVGPGKRTLHLYDHVAGRQACVEGLAEIRREEAGFADGIDARYEGTERIVSVVGTFVTTLIDYGGYCGGAHPFQRRSFDTVDLANDGKSVTLAAIFGSGAQAAIVRHRRLKAAMSDEEASVPGEPWSSPHFAFNAVDGEFVVVRLGLPHAVEVSAGTFGAFDIRLPIPASLRNALLRADKAGTLLPGLAPAEAALAEGVYRDGVKAD